MGAETPDSGAAIRVGRFEVRASPEDIARFTAALGDDPRVSPEVVPISFPVTWLGRIDISTALKTAAAAWADRQNHALVHLAQTVSVGTPLRVDAPYLLDLELTPPDGSGTMRVEASILGRDDIICATLAGDIALVQVGSPI